MPVLPAASCCCCVCVGRCCFCRCSCCRCSCCCFCCCCFVAAASLAATAPATAAAGAGLAQSHQQLRACLLLPWGLHDAHGQPPRRDCARSSWATSADSPPAMAAQALWRPPLACRATQARLMAGKGRRHARQHCLTSAPMGCTAPVLQHQRSALGGVELMCQALQCMSVDGAVRFGR